MTSPRGCYPQPVSFGRHYLTSGGFLCLSVAKQIQDGYSAGWRRERRQCRCSAQRSSNSTSCHIGSQQGPESNVHPFAFKPLPLASLVDSKNLETLRSMGGLMQYSVLGTQPAYGLSTKLRPQCHDLSPDPTFSESCPHTLVSQS